MHIISSEELLLKQAPIYSKDRIVFNNKLLNRGPSFAKKLKQAAINFCQQTEQAKLFHLIVESSCHVTVWTEDEQTQERERNSYNSLQPKMTENKQQKAQQRAESRLLEEGKYSSTAENIRIETLARLALEKGDSTDLVIQKLMQDRFFREVQEKIGSERTLESISKLVGSLVTEMLIKKLKSSYNFIKN